MIGHGLLAEGAGFREDGVRLRPYTVGGPGRARCACGAMSDELPSAAARKRWHRVHKALVRL